MKKHSEIITEYERELFIQRPEGKAGLYGISWERVRLWPKATTPVPAGSETTTVCDWINANVGEPSGEFTTIGDPADTLVLIKQERDFAIHQTMG